MSRSFGKKSQGYSISRGWHRSMRVRERLMIHREMRSEYQGDVVFPVAKEFPRDYNINFALFYYKKETRDNYFTEIRDILNGFQEWEIRDLWYRRERTRELRSDCQQDFIEKFHRIKRRETLDGRRFRVDWLLTREAKEAVKNWEGDPLDILYYLTSSGIIEKAVRIEYKRVARK